MNFKFPQFSPTPLASIIPTASREAISLMEDMLRSDYLLLLYINIPIFVLVKQDLMV